MRLQGPNAQILVAINAGSSSIKFGVFTGEMVPLRLAIGLLDRLGHRDAQLRIWEVRNGSDHTTVQQSLGAAAQADAAGIIANWLDDWMQQRTLMGIGHRLVHGGLRVRDHQLITDPLRRDLAEAVLLDPTHLPRQLALVDGLRRRFSGVPHVVCLDTAFHRRLPRTATLLPIPRRFIDSGVQRYGFHGLSFEYLLTALDAQRTTPRASVDEKILLAHLGSGASLAAVRGGIPVDTSMAFTPTSGLMMGTRCGDLDPGVVVHMAREGRLNAEQLDELLNHECGLLGVSDTSSDVRDLLRSRSTDSRADEALSLFCWQARKWIGSMAAVLGGVDTLVFTGGIGEHTPALRQEICAGLAFLGIRLDPGRNESGRPGPISADDAQVDVLVIPTNEELTIARHTHRLIQVRDLHH